MGIALGLGAALSWGLADYFAAVASRRMGALGVVLLMHLVALVPLAVVVLVTGGLAGLTLGQLGVLCGMGAVGWLSYRAFYGALAIGPISVLSPIVSGYAAVTVLLAVVVSSEQLSGLQAIAVAVTIAGAVCACLDFGAIAQARVEPRSALGFALALCAMALLGGFVFGVSYYRPHLGWVAPIFLARGFATVFLVANVLGARGARPPRPSRSVARDYRLAGVSGHRRIRVLQPRGRIHGHGSRRRGLSAVCARAGRHGRSAVQRASNPAAMARGRTRHRRSDHPRTRHLVPRPNSTVSNTTARHPPID